MDLADEAVVAETAAGVAVGFADFAGEVAGEVAADSELAASTKECRSGERSTCKLWSALWTFLTRPKARSRFEVIRRKATEISTRFCALGDIIYDLHPKYFIT